MHREHVMANICPNRIYEIPADMPMLLCDLHNLNVGDIDVEKSIEEWKFCSFKYDNLCHLSTNQKEETKKLEYV